MIVFLQIFALVLVSETKKFFVLFRKVFLILIQTHMYVCISGTFANKYLWYNCKKAKVVRFQIPGFRTFVNNKSISGAF